MKVVDGHRFAVLAWLVTGLLASKRIPCASAQPSPSNVIDQRQDAINNSIPSFNVTITLLKDIAPGPNSSLPKMLVSHPPSTPQERLEDPNHKFFLYAAHTPEHGWEPWITTMNRNGCGQIDFETRILYDMCDGPEDGARGIMGMEGIWFRNQFYYIADHAFHGRGLWVFGPATTSAKHPPEIGPNLLSNPASLFVVKDQFFIFIVQPVSEDPQQLQLSSSSRSALHRSDGTVEGAHPIIPEFPWNFCLPRLGRHMVLENLLMFESTGAPWVTDGAPAGTLPIFETDEHIAGIFYCFLINGQVHFRVGYSSTARMWNTNGTVEGTRLFANMTASRMHPLLDNNATSVLIVGENGLALYDVNDTLVESEMLPQELDLFFGPSPFQTRDTWSQSPKIAATAIGSHCGNSMEQPASFLFCMATEHCGQSKHIGFCCPSQWLFSLGDSKSKSNMPHVAHRCGLECHQVGMPIRTKGKKLETQASHWWNSLARNECHGRVCSAGEIANG